MHRSHIYEFGEHTAALGPCFNPRLRMRAEGLLRNRLQFDTNPTNIVNIRRMLNVPHHRDRRRLARRGDRGHATGSGVVTVPVDALTDTLALRERLRERFGSGGIRLSMTACSGERRRFAM
jgi:hypothetical protein